MTHTGRRSPWLTVAVMLMMSASMFASSPAGLKKRVAVMDMSMVATTMAQSSPGTLSITTTIQIPPPADFAMGLTEILTTELANTGKVIVLERKALADITAEQDLATAGRVNTETSARTGAIVGAQALVRCGITEYSYTQTGTSASIKIIQGLNVGASVVRAMVGLDCRLYDATTTEVLASTVARGTATAKGADIKYSTEKVEGGAGGFMATPLGQASRQAIDQAVAFIVDKVGDAPWEARVIRFQEDQVYLNAGEESGVSVGETFGLYRPGESLVDPSSGLDLGTPDEMIGTIKIKSVKPKYAVAVLVDGEAPKRNDIVRPVSAGNNP